MKAQRHLRNDKSIVRFRLYHKYVFLNHYINIMMVAGAYQQVGVFLPNQ